MTGGDRRRGGPEPDDGLPPPLLQYGLHILTIRLSWGDYGMELEKCLPTVGTILVFFREKLPTVGRTEMPKASHKEFRKNEPSYRRSLFLDLFT